MTGKLLCVIRHPERQQGLLDSLQTCGFEVDVATNRHTALSLSEQESYDVALLDEEVERHAGIDIFRDIDNLQEHVDGILCCENPTIDRVDSAIAAGMNHVVCKPLNATEVVCLLSGAACESSRPFGDRFPNAPLNSHNDAGMTKGETEGECETCGRSTHWYHGTQHTYFCCEDCLMRFRSLHEA